MPGTVTQSCEQGSKGSKSWKQRLGSYHRGPGAEGASVTNPGAEAISAGSYTGTVPSETLHADFLARRKPTFLLFHRQLSCEVRGSQPLLGSLYKFLTPTEGPGELLMTRVMNSNLYPIRN